MYPRTWYVGQNGFVAETSTSPSSPREKIRGSPRFPHRIVPANSLNAIAPGSSISQSHRWHSMEDARKTKVVQAPRGSSCSPSCDVWATREIVIPLKELGGGTRGRKPPESLTLPAAVESRATSDDAKLGRNQRKLFKENYAYGAVNPVEFELKIARSASSSSSSPSNTRKSSGTNEASSSRKESGSESVTGVAQFDASTNFVQELYPRPSSPVVLVTNVDVAEETDSPTNTPREAGESTAV